MVAPGTPFGRRDRHGTQVRREREQRPGHRLGQAIAGQEAIVADPPGIDHRRVEERQDHVTAAEHECAGAIEAVEQRDRLAARSAQERKREEQDREGSERDDADPARHRTRFRTEHGRGRRCQDEPTDDGARRR